MRISDWSSDVCSSDLPLRPDSPAFARDDRFGGPSSEHRIAEAVIAIDGAAIFVAIFGSLVARIARRARNLILGQVYDIAALVGVIGQHLPRNGIMIAADAEEHAEFKHGIVALARALVDHHIDDRTDLFIFQIIDRGALNLVRGDQAMGLDRKSVV